MLIVMIAITTLHSCYYDNADELFPVQGGGCDTSGTITYKTHIQPILIGYCGSENSCHNIASNSNRNICLADYNSVASIDSTIFIKSIEHTSDYPMPKNGGKLNPCRIDLIKKWLRTGKTNI